MNVGIYFRNRAKKDEKRIVKTLARPPKADSLALVIEDDESLCRFLSRLLTMLGMECCAYPSAATAIGSLDRRHPAIIFLDLTLRESHAIDVIKGLAERKYSGLVQLTSGDIPDLLEPVQWIAMRRGLSMLPPLRKPFRAEAVREAIATLGRDVPKLPHEDFQTKNSAVATWHATTSEQTRAAVALV